MEENPYSGICSALGLFLGILIGLAKENLVFGFMIGVIISIAMEWGANLYALYIRNKE